MATIPFYVVDAFTSERFNGNPAGVFLDNDARLTGEQMKQLAGEVHLESAFVSPPSANFSDADFHFRYFTGLTEVPLCGHATVAAVTVLCQIGRITFGPQDARADVKIQTNIGVLRVQILRTSAGGFRVRLYQNAPIFGPALSDALQKKTLHALGATLNDKVSGFPLQSVSTGTPWLFVPVQTRDIVDNAPADLPALLEISKQTDTWGADIFAIETDGAGVQTGVQTWGRCFAPIAGLNEDPVTGSASGALGGYLAHHGVLSVPKNGAAGFTAQQGWAGGRGGAVQIGVSHDEGGTLGVHINGSAIVVAEGQFVL